MPNPVAEVVERLRKAADNIERARMSGIVENLAGWEQRHARDAADLLERLSRERDTGVPEGFVVVPKEPTREMLKAGAWARHSQACDGGHNIVGREAAEVCWPAMISAAPQPPTVSTQGWRTPNELPELKDGERLDVYLSFDNGEVKLAGWTAWTTYGSEYHASTGVYLGQFAQDGGGTET